jgi:hypothetical protein
MKSILQYWRDQLQTERNPGLYLGVFAILGVFIAINYLAPPSGYFSWEYWLIKKYYSTRSLGCYPLYFLFYLVPYVLVLLWSSRFHEQVRTAIQNPRFWGRLVFIFGLLAFHESLGWVRYIRLNDFPATDRYWIYKMLAALSPILTLGLPLFLFWFIFDRKKTPFFYGFTFKGFDIKPYLILLGLMVPIVLIAAQFTQFSSYYPTLRPERIQKVVSIQPSWLAFACYQIAYGLYFIWAEIVFRGYLVIGMNKHLGAHAVLPSAAPYVFRHFAKPPGETISSLFGGWLLGVISYRTQSVLGGAMIHAGIAILMDTIAYLIILSNQ